jgi:hypothetical protein
MNISYSGALSRAWGRMKKALFCPFDINKWFVVGFTAFLAGLADKHGGSSSPDSKWKGKPDLNDIAEFPARAWDWLLDHPGWFVLIVFGLVFLITLIVVFTWLSSRGKFMFLDNVVHDRAQVTKPWRQFKKHGDSLFVWRLIYGFICLALFILYLFFCYLMVLNIYEGSYPHGVFVLTIIGMVLAGLIFFIITGYISLFLNDFVVPIMYKYNLTTIQAWNRFLPIFGKYLFYFLLYGLFVFLLVVLVVIFVIVAGFLTCCIGFLLLIIPYVGSVIMLPVSYTFRALGPEFLGQFGPEFFIFPEEEDISVSSTTQQ